MHKLGKKQEQKKKTLKIKIILFLVICAIVLVTLPFSGLIENKINSKRTENIGDFATLIEKDCVVHVIDVGCADCIALELPDGKKGLVDGGVYISSKVKSTYQQNSVNYIKQYVFDGNENGTFDFVVMTHPDADHYNNYELIFDTFQINKVYRPPVFYNKDDDAQTQKEIQRAKDAGLMDGSETAFDENTFYTIDTKLFSKCLDKMYSEPGCEIVFTLAPTTADIVSSDALKPYTIRFYGPRHTCYPTKSYNNNNSFSALMTLEYKGHSIMLTGDTTKEEEKDVMDACDLPEVDVLKVAHHGSNTSSSVAFLNKIKPKYALISTRTDTNKYNLPKQEIIDRIISCGVSEDNILQTQKSGNLVFAIDSDDMYIGATTEVVVKTIKWWYVCAGVIVASGAFIFGVKIKTSKRK